MKLIIQIPCYNEAEHIAETLSCIPRDVAGFSKVELLVIDDGSSDKTSDVAKQNGADHVLRHSTNLGLARAFETGLNTALSLGADVIVNTDADNQYCADDIPKLTEPLIKKEAEIAIGARPISSIEHFSPLKKLLQKLGSAAVKQISGADVADAPSGFRAYTREAALRIHIFSDYTYTLETIIQAGLRQIPMVSVPIRVNGPTRPSRLVKSIFSYVRRSVETMFRIYIIYQPLRFFGFLSFLLCTPGVLLGLRFLVAYLNGEGTGKIQSLILASVCILSGILMLVAGIIADLISVNRKLHEQSVYLLRKSSYTEPTSVE